ncbi:tyrosine-type recombinase/integrase [Streptomyces acidicola]|uniref:tyrosine-type recombinase/integrase n=1 Tax=Streptomyces acidicola TaxID=2596892 RepID=UPI00344A6DD0
MHTSDRAFGYGFFTLMWSANQVAKDSRTTRRMARPDPVWARSSRRSRSRPKHRKDPKKYGPYVDSGYVFTQADGRTWHPDSVSQAFKRLIKRLGLPPVRLHDLRHCAASLSLAASLSMKAIQSLLGHASYSLTADTRRFAPRVGAR